MALRVIFDHLSINLRIIEQNLLKAIFGSQFPPPAVAFDTIDIPKDNINSKFTLKDIIGDGFLYAVPKFRRTIEKRLCRKFGDPKRVYKPLIPKTNLLVCNTCGSDHEIGVLCGTCYKRIMAETKEMQKQIMQKLYLQPVTEEVVVLYEGEQLEESEEFWKGKRIIEMKKPRPAWFSKNLLQKTTQKPATTTDVKPTELA